jgi:hypothetical protein
MELKEVVEQLEKSGEFKEWKKLNPHYYLAHGFMIYEDAEWQVGYSDGEKVTTFFLNPVKVMPEQECYKRPGAKVMKLDSSELKLSLSGALAVFEKVKSKKYSAEVVMKKIVLVQNIGKPVYNITGLTVSIKTLNVKVGMDGEVVEDSCKGIVQQ